MVQRVNENSTQLRLFVTTKCWKTISGCHIHFKIC